MFAVIRSLLWREMTLAIRRRAEVLTTLFFFVIVVSLFPLGVGPEIE
ncbi:MAG: heme exporter protein CcmB, partial [Gammaproteobacteria bacterium]|nr:heme exporter protein CcmB [Gammaproteobacteria bacterium]